MLHGANRSPNMLIEASVLQFIRRFGIEIQTVIENKKIRPI